LRAAPDMACAQIHCRSANHSLQHMHSSKVDTLFVDQGVTLRYRIKILRFERRIIIFMVAPSVPPDSGASLISPHGMCVSFVRAIPFKEKTHNFYRSIMINLIVHSKSCTFNSGMLPCRAEIQCRTIISFQFFYFIPHVEVCATHNQNSKWDLSEDMRA